VQPVSVEEVAELSVAAGEREGDERFDAAGPEELTFGEVVRVVRAAVGSRAVLAPAPTTAILALSRVFDRIVRDVLVTRDELEGLCASLLTSDEPPRGTASFRAWVDAHGAELGRSYVSELARNFRGYAPL
jgi:NADH dehydrogenase